MTSHYQPAHNVPHKSHHREKDEPDIVRVHREHHPEAGFFVICLPGMTQKFRENPSIPIIDVVEKFDVYVGTGTDALHPTPGDLKSEFGTDQTEEVIRQILNRGTIV